MCPNNGGLLFDEAQQPKLCMDNIECQGSGKGAYFCNNGYCCPESGKCIDQLVLIALSPLERQQKVHDSSFRERHIYFLNRFPVCVPQW